MNGSPGALSGRGSTPCAPGRRSSSRAGTPTAGRADEPGPARDPEQLGALVRPDRARRQAEAPLDDEGDTSRLLERLAAPGRGRQRRGGAAPHGGGRRPRAGRHRHRDPDPVDLRRSGDAAQGRDASTSCPAAAGTTPASAPTPSTWPGATTSPRWSSRAEHYAPIVHNWVCWAAPVHDPVSGELLGVIDLSTTWDRTHPIGLATARVMAQPDRDARCRPPTTTRAPAPRPPSGTG